MLCWCRRWCTRKIDIGRERRVRDVIRTEVCVVAWGPRCSAPCHPDCTAEKWKNEYVIIRWRRRIEEDWLSAVCSGIRFRDENTLPYRSRGISRQERGAGAAPFPKFRTSTLAEGPVLRLALFITRFIADENLRILT
ncbi:hypothetical protein GWI33_020513 [Rhynchophorus ferrugineus]|uniref:Uncharacterized protein n=1 Tax=Rhynchophorus ferrugineus TaxID=354439 RepID=A0A834M0F4_RHYFE|nr:hypothetical protein GWI33_020513 [Rhynchophorus ferrugineus]